MIEKMFTGHAWLWLLAWQSTAVLAFGIAGSVLLRNRAVRAHRLLLLGLITALAVPALTTLVRQHHWGLLAAQPVPVHVQGKPIVLLDASSTADSTPNAARPTTETTTTPVSAVTPKVQHHAISWRMLAMIAWASVSGALALRLMARFLLGYQLTRQSEPVEDEGITEAIRRARIQLDIRVDVLCRQSAGTHSPVIWCWGRRPIPLVPSALGDRDAIDWSSVVCHELAHWRRRDHLSGLWAELTVCALPWNPLVWMAQRRLVRLSEEACDDWVIASGQLGTRYARTLLGLTPQGHAALVPAMVSSRKGLATRVRRILADQCANPRSGKRWTLIVTATTWCLTVGVALAQAGAAKSTGMIRTELPDGAVIEQLASTGLIKGTVRDPNGNPTPGYTTRLTVLPMTCYGVSSNDAGHFEIPWSPTWIDAGQPLYLVARDSTRNLARIVEVTDPEAPVTIELEPGTAIEGKVVDLGGRPIYEAVVAASLPVQFQCWAPIAGVDTDKQGDFTLGDIPGNRAYTMEVRAEGYETKLVDVSVPGTEEKAVRLAPITLVPRGPTQRAIPMPGPNAGSYETFQAVHTLGDGEAVKLVKTPFMRHRQHEITKETEGTNGLLDYPYIVHQYRWDGRLEDGCWYANNAGLTSIRTVMNAFLDIPSYEFELPEHLADVHVSRGDWIVRKDATTAQKLGALEAIVRAELHRPIHFERRQVERDVVVATGRYTFTPLPGKDPNRLYAVAEPDEEVWDHEVDSLPQLLAQLANGIKIAIDDRTEPAETGKILFASNSVFFSQFASRPIDTEKTLPLLLDNLAKQTGLTFTVEKQSVDVWFASEDKREGRG